MNLHQGQEKIMIGSKITDLILTGEKRKGQEGGKKRKLWHIKALNFYGSGL
ncbi:hypothetical protein E2542_SST20903 [Spatholobus suberectus]|nr:hypothetical protein E2542_SST20903 [Spatholobus suberectus]